MKKKLFPILVISIMFLAACSNASDESQLTEPVATAVIEGSEAVTPTGETTASQ